MKTILSLLALLSVGGIAGAQTTTGISPLGPWALCESTPQVSGILCAGFVPGHEEYMLTIGENVGAGTVSYRYTASAVLASTGQEITIAGNAERRDDLVSLGFTYTDVTLNFGGIVGPISITVWNRVNVGMITITHLPQMMMGK